MTDEREGICELEVRRRRLRDGPMPVLTSPEQTARCFSDLVERDRETLCVACLDTRNQLIGRHVVFLGTTDAVMIHPREILRVALLSMATRIVVVHNHPSGNPSPSLDDLYATEKLAEACGVVGVTLLDHVIVGRGGTFWSWANDGRHRRRQRRNPCDHE